MPNYNKKLTETSVRIGEVELNYCHLFEPAAGMNGGDPKYSVQIRIPKTDTQTIEMLTAAIDAAKAQGVSSKWGGKRPGNLKLPLRDGDVDYPDDETMRGKMFFNCSSKNKPGVQVLEGGSRHDAMPDEVQSTDLGCVSVNAFPYDASGSKGVALGLNNVIRTQEGPRTFGAPSADADFGDLGDSEDW